MKKITYKIFFLFLFILVSCVPPQSDMQTFKIKVVNLETMVAKQEEKIQKIETKLDTIEKKLQDLENKLSGEVLIDIKTRALAELEEIKNQQNILSSQLEDIKFFQEEQNKEFNTKIENISTQIQALELRIRTIEAKLGISNATMVSNATVSENATSISNATKIATVKEPVKKKPLDEVSLYEKAYTSYKNGNFEKARKLFTEYINRFPKGKWIGQAYFWIGESYFKEKRYEEAILNYQKLIELKGWHPLKPAALLKQAKAFKALGDTEAYKILLKKLINDYPNTKEAQKAKKLLNL